MNDAAVATDEYESTIDTKLMYTSFKWYLKKWSVMTEHYKKGVISDPIVITGTAAECTLKFQMLVNYDDVYCIVNSPKNFTFCRMQYSISFVDQKMKKLLMHQSVPFYNSIIGPGCLNVKLCSQKEFLEGTRFILDDTLIILFEIQHVQKVTSPMTSVGSFGGSGNIVYDNNDLYDDTDFCDIKFFFKETGRTLTAHKVVLAARSPVFRAMFTTDMKELQSGEVTIEDFGDTVFKKFLRYVYTGTTDVSEDVASELMAIANKYQVPSLMNLCARYMCAHINNKNVLSYFDTAHRNSATNLEKRASAYIKTHLHEVLAQAIADGPCFIESLADAIQLIFRE